MKNKKRALFNSVISLLLCLSMFVGTTFAWFTDEVTSGGNIIASGNLDATMEYATAPDGQWQDASEGTIFGYEFWEPGYTDMKFIRVGNIGNLAFRYQLHIVPAEATPEGEANLADVIDVYCGVVDENFVAPTDFSENMPGMTKMGTLSELLGKTGGAASGILLPTDGADRVTLDPEDEPIAETGTSTMCIMLHMQETAGNEYQDLDVAGHFQLRLLATQYTYEDDSFGNDYDTDSEFPLLPGNWSVSTPVDVTNNETAEAVNVGAEGDRFTANVPVGVKVNEGTEKLNLKISTLLNSEANVTLKQGEKKTALDVHMEGVAEDNTVPMVITLGNILPTGLNSTSVTMYHVEDGITVPMTQVTNPANHNEFSYDPATGTVVMCVASFSEYVAITNNLNRWEGTANTDWYNEDASEYKLITAEQLAGFGILVDQGVTFENKTVYLDKDIDLGGGVSFNPIGCGYVTGVANSNNVEGFAFKGTFDGQNHTISGLFQNGWDIGLSYCNLGGGLFASICDGTVKNLTITGANIAMECVEMGVLVGLSQGTCTYENIKIYNSKIANYQKATGGLIGEVSAGSNGGGTTTIKNVTIGSNVVVGSLWGDFDAPVGGVIGARWDDSNTTSVVMDNVEVSCRLDVYNDITSTYQWHAYRRAGMLIGNTDTPPADGKHSATATADFLTCEDVTVRYGKWVDYHYCQFTNHNSSWPWVRVEAGENCAAYSNPRYGVPYDINGKKVENENHTHQSGDSCMEEIPFNQLYGGGQGIYGQPKHENVDVIEYLYSVTYINNGKVLDVKYVTEADLASDGKFSTANSVAKEQAEQDMGAGYEVNYWMNAGSTQIDSIDAGNETDIVLYPSFKNRYTVTYVDNQGNILHWETINAGDKTTATTPAVPVIEGGYTGEWSMTDFSEISGDVTVYPIYNAQDGIVKLTPVDSEPKDGVVDYYQVTNVEENDDNVNIVIPESFNGKPVMEVTGGAFAEFDNITTVRIPTSITTIGADAFANKDNSGAIGTLKYEQITFLYEGTYEQWQAIKKDANWDRYVGQGSRIYFLADGTYSEETERNGTWTERDRVWSEPKEGTYAG